MTIPYEKGLRMAAVERIEEDRGMRDRLRRYKKAFHVGQIITSEIDRDLLFEVIIHQTNEVMESERSTVFVHDNKTNELWSLVGVGLKKREIRIPSDYGVAGSDLLRAKVFSERHGFSVDFESTRCRFIPDDTDECSGKISECPFIKTRSECLSSGGSTFSVSFPIDPDNCHLGGVGLGNSQ